MKHFGNFLIKHPILWSISFSLLFCAFMALLAFCVDAIGTGFRWFVFKATFAIFLYGLGGWPILGSILFKIFPSFWDKFEHAHFAMGVLYWGILIIGGDPLFQKYWSLFF